MEPGKSLAVDSRRLTRFALRLFIAPIAATAIVGLWAISIPDDDWEFEINVLLTTATIAAASVCGLICSGCLALGHRVLPGAGLMLTLVSAVLLLVGIWAEVGSEAFWKSAASLAFYAVACAHLSMLFMANLTAGYRWAYVVAYQLILGLATLMAAGVQFEFFEQEGYVRLTGAISILVAAITLMIPVFHRLSRDKVVAMQAEADPLFAVDEEIARVKKRLIELENKRRDLLGRPQVVAPSSTDDGTSDQVD